MTAHLRLIKSPARKVESGEVASFTLGGRETYVRRVGVQYVAMYRDTGRSVDGLVHATHFDAAKAAVRASQRK